MVLTWFSGDLIDVKLVDVLREEKWKDIKSLYILFWQPRELRIPNLPSISVNGSHGHLPYEVSPHLGLVELKTRGALLAM